MNNFTFETDVMRTYNAKNHLDIIQWLAVSNSASEEGQDLLTLVNAVMGLTGESGEAEEIVKKALFQGHPLDYTHLAHELGDVAYYLVLACHVLGYSLDDILRMNMEKRKERYPEGFDEWYSTHRRDGDI